MMKTKILALLSVGALTMWGCDSDDDDNGDTAATISGTAGDDGGTATDDGDDDGGTTVAGDDGDDDGVTPADSTDDGTGVCDPACPDGEECVEGVCFPGGDEDGTTDDGTDDGTGGGEGDPNYPNPADGCPEGSLDLNMGVMFNVCGPACDPMAANAVAACPDATEGAAVGACGIYGTMSSGDCDEASLGLPCETVGEFCAELRADVFTCNPGAACVLNCSAAQGVACPSGMTCNAADVCVY